jgi:hypothetical protein
MLHAGHEHKQRLTSLAHAATKRSPRNLAFSYKPKDRLLRMQPAK